MLIAIFVLFVILGGYFACCESAFSAMNKIRIKNLAETTTTTSASQQGKSTTAAALDKATTAETTKAAE